jgi:hypothetical protein
MITVGPVSLPIIRPPCKSVQPGNICKIVGGNCTEGCQMYKPKKPEEEEQHAKNDD